MFQPCHVLIRERRRHCQLDCLLTLLCHAFLPTLASFQPSKHLMTSCQLIHSGYNGNILPIMVISVVFGFSLSISDALSHISTMWLYKSRYALSASLMLLMGMYAAEAQRKLCIPKSLECSIGHLRRSISGMESIIPSLSMVVNIALTNPSLSGGNLRVETSLVVSYSSSLSKKLCVIQCNEISDI